jgi:hypothetical protein
MLEKQRSERNRHQEQREGSDAPGSRLIFHGAKLRSDKSWSTTFDAAGANGAHLSF